MVEVGRQKSLGEEADRACIMRFIFFSRYHELTEKEVLDHLVHRQRYDRRELPPSNGERTKSNHSMRTPYAHQCLALQTTTLLFSPDVNPSSPSRTARGERQPDAAFPEHCSRDLLLQGECVSCC